MNFLTLFKSKDLALHLAVAGGLGLSQLFLAQPVLAQTTAAPAQDPMRALLLNLPIFLALFGVIWFAVIRPQKDQQKRQQAFMNTLKKGDEVVTSGGILGTIVGLTDRVVTLEISQGTDIKVLRSQIQALVSEALSVAATTTT